MRYPVLLIAAFSGGLVGCSTGQAQATGPDSSRSFNVAAFDRIEVAGPFAVQVTTGGQRSVRAQGPSDVLERMVVEVDGRTLRIHPEKRRGLFGGWNSGGAGGTVRVAVSVPMLNAAAIAGSGNIAVDRIDAQSFSGSVAGSGELRLPQVEVRSLRLEIAGSGDAMAAGRAAEGHYEIAGSGDIQAARVATDQARVEIAGSGNVEANARSAARVEIAGSGNVRVTGGARCSIDKVGSGNVECS